MTDTESTEAIVQVHTLKKQSVLYKQPKKKKMPEPEPDEEDEDEDDDDDDDEDEEEEEIYGRIAKRIKCQIRDDLAVCLFSLQEMPVHCTTHRDNQLYL